MIFMNVKQAKKRQSCCDDSHGIQPLDLLVATLILLGLSALLSGCASPNVGADRYDAWVRASRYWEIKHCGKGQADPRKRKAECAAARKQLQFWKDAPLAEAKFNKEISR